VINARINGKIKMSDQPAELPRVRAKLFAFARARQVQEPFALSGSCGRHALLIPSRDGFIIVS